MRKLLCCLLGILLFASCKQDVESGYSNVGGTTSSLPKEEMGMQGELALDSAVNKAEASPEASFPKSSPSAIYSFNIIPAEGNTFGYEILQDGKPMIRQNAIPGLPGNKGFDTKADAEKIAELVVGKLKKGEMPPSVTPEEMKQMNVIQ